MPVCRLQQLLLLLVALPSASAGFAPSSGNAFVAGRIREGSSSTQPLGSSSWLSLRYSSSSSVAVTPFFTPRRNTTEACGSNADYLPAAYLQLAPVPSSSTAVIAAPRIRLEDRPLASPSSTSFSRKTATANPAEQFHLYVDLDGVLCDFESGVRSLFPELVSSSAGSSSSFQLQQLERHEMWKRIASHNAPFFRNLPWARGGKELWNAVRHLRPDILTGVPATLATSRAEKYAWCVRELFFPGNSEDRHCQKHDDSDTEDDAATLVVEHVDMAGRFFRHARVNPHDLDSTTSEAAKERRRQQHQRVITCWSSNKHHESRPGAVLIDDCLQLKEAWEQKGGIFIHHQTGNAERTLRQLVEHGILDDSFLLQP